MSPIRRVFPALLLACCSLCVSSNNFASRLPRLQVEGQTLVAPEGKPAILKGVNLGNWLLVEPGVFGGALGDFPDQDTLFTTLHARFGKDGANRLIKAYRDNFIQERDIAETSRFGVNLLRVGFDYSIFEDDSRPMRLRADAFRYTDRVLEWAEKFGMYVLFDLHGAQERQGRGKPCGRADYNRFWDDPSAQERSLWLWQEIARRYQNRPNVLGYEALNEPWGKSPEALRAFCERWYRLMRPIDSQVILVFPGWTNDLKFYGPPASHGFTNVAFDMHFYPGQFRWGTPGPEVHEQFLTKGLPEWQRTMNQLKAPLIVGEIKVVYPGPGTAKMTRRYLDFFAGQGWPMIQWTWKEFRLKSVAPTGGWMLATNGVDLPQLDFRSSSERELERFFESLGAMPLRLDEELLHWMTSQEMPSAL